MPAALAPIDLAPSDEVPQAAVPVFVEGVAIERGEEMRGADAFAHRPPQPVAHPRGAVVFDCVIEPAARAPALSERLREQALAQGWDARGGLYYTVEYDGAPRVRDPA